MAMSRFEGCSPATSLPAILISPPRDRLQAGDGVQERGLAAAGRTDQHEEAALLDLQRDVLEDARRAEGFFEVLDLQKRH